MQPRAAPTPVLGNEILLFPYIVVRDTDIKNDEFERNE